MIRTRCLTLVARCALAVLACAPSAAAQTPAARAADDTREVNLRAYVDLLRSDLRAQKVAVIAEVMEFTDAEDAKFWPVYREYETELATINDDRMKLIREYAMSFDKLTDAQADGFAMRALGLEARRQALTSGYYQRFKTVLPAKTAVRFLQVEHQILLLLDLQIAASLPVAAR